MTFLRCLFVFFSFCVGAFAQDIKEQCYKAVIRENLTNTIDSGIYPSLGKHRSGKVRDLHFTGDKPGSKIVMIVSDRISAFDYQADRSIPFKGAVLNLLNQWAFEQTKDIIPNASLQFPHSHVIVQKYCTPLKVECIVRGYVWGSLAADYEKGEREKCGVKLPGGLIRYQKLYEPIFTPTHKSENDEPMTFEEMKDLIGAELAEKIRDISIKLYKRGQKLAEERGMLFIDTKYEFGLDENGELLLIDEANTPDSSRYCTIDEYEKFGEIKKKMDRKMYRNVSDLLNWHPKLKIKELSKQFLRDLWTEKGFTYGSMGEPPRLTDEEVVELSYRYIDLYEKLTGNTFPFTKENLEKSLVNTLIYEGFMKGDIDRDIAKLSEKNAKIEIRVGSDSDLPKIQEAFFVLDQLNIDYEVRILSAHRTPHEMMAKAYSLAEENFFVCIGSAGGSAHLPGMTASETPLPVIALPVKTSFLDGLDSLLSMVQMPPGIPNGVVGIDHSRSAALAAAQIAYLGDHQVMRRICQLRGIPYHNHTPESKVAIVKSKQEQYGDDFTKALELFKSSQVQVIEYDIEQRGLINQAVKSGCSAIYLICDLEEDGILHCQSLANSTFLPFVVIPHLKGKKSVSPEFFHEILSNEAALCMGLNRFSNGALYCLQIIGDRDPSVRNCFNQYRYDLSKSVIKKNQKLEEEKVHRYLSQNFGSK